MDNKEFKNSIVSMTPQQLKALVALATSKGFIDKTQVKKIKAYDAWFNGTSWHITNTAEQEFYLLHANEWRKRNAMDSIQNLVKAYNDLLYISLHSTMNEFAKQIEMVKAINALNGVLPRERLRITKNGDGTISFYHNMHTNIYSFADDEQDYTILENLQKLGA